MKSRTLTIMLQGFSFKSWFPMTEENWEEKKKKKRYEIILII